MSTRVDRHRRSMKRPALRLSCSNTPAIIQPSASPSGQDGSGSQSAEQHNIMSPVVHPTSLEVDATNPSTNAFVSDSSSVTMVGVFWQANVG